MLLLLLSFAHINLVAGSVQVDADCGAGGVACGDEGCGVTLEAGWPPERRTHNARVLPLKAGMTEERAPMEKRKMEASPEDATALLLQIQPEDSTPPLMW
jgi:hypothetical protein